MSEKKSEDQSKRLTWGNLFSSVTARRYGLVTNTDYLVDGLKKLCESGFTDPAYNVLEYLLGRHLPILPCHEASIPVKCMVFEAPGILGYEAGGYIIAFELDSYKSGRREFTCIYFDDTRIYARLCSLSEMQEVYTVYSEVSSNQGGVGGVGGYE